MLHTFATETDDETVDPRFGKVGKQWLNEPMQHLLKEHIQTLVDYPPVQKAASFDFSELIKQMQEGQQ